MYRHTQHQPLLVVSRLSRLFALLLGYACGVSGVLESDDCICLWPLLALDDVEFHLIAFFQSFVPVQLNG